MNPARTEALLQPTLTTTGKPFSVRAHFFVAFIGGPLALLLFAAASARRLGRLRQDAWFYGLLACATVAAIVGVTIGFPPTLYPEYSKTIRLGARASGLLLLGVIYLKDRQLHRAAELWSDPPSPWRTAVLCLVIGIALHFTFVAAVIALQTP